MSARRNEDVEALTRLNDENGDVAMPVHIYEAWRSTKKEYGQGILGVGFYVKIEGTELI